jgi:hypothetical protein
MYGSIGLIRDRQDLLKRQKQNHYSRHPHVHSNDKDTNDENISPPPISTTIPKAMVMVAENSKIMATTATPIGAQRTIDNLTDICWKFFD